MQWTSDLWQRQLRLFPRRRRRLSLHWAPGKMRGVPALRPRQHVSGRAGLLCQLLLNASLWRLLSRSRAGVPPRDGPYADEVALDRANPARDAQMEQSGAASRPESNLVGWLEQRDAGGVRPDSRLGLSSASLIDPLQLGMTNSTNFQLSRGNLRGFEAIARCGNHNRNGGGGNRTGARCQSTRWHPHADHSGEDRAVKSAGDGGVGLRG